MAQSMTTKTLENQNRFFVGTGGISPENRDLGFVPGFMDRETGFVYRSCMADGRPATMHLIDGLPEELVLSRSASGRVASVKNSLIAGFIRDGCFYTREQVAGAVGRAQ